jgi:hypothetical protein
MEAHDATALRLAVAVHRESPLLELEACTASATGTASGSGTASALAYTGWQCQWQRRY